MNEKKKYLRYAIKYEIKGRKLPLNMPNFCPICMSPEIAGLQKLRDTTTGRKYVLVPLCSKHYNFNRKNVIDYLNIKYTKNIITVLIKHSDWAEEFKKINQCEYYELNEQLIKELDPKIAKLFVILFIWIGFNIFIAVVSITIILQEWLINFLNILVVIGFLTIGSLLLYYNIKQERMKTVYELIKNPDEINNQNEKKY